VVYSIEEVCSELAKRVGKPTSYSPQRIYQLIHTYRPTLEKAGKRFFLTEADVDYLARAVKKIGRPKNT